VSDILFVTWDGGGNVPPALGIARELQARGHTIRFLGHASQREHLTVAGFEVEPPRHAQRFTALEGGSPLAQVRAFSDRGMGRDLLDAVAARPTDLVVVDCLMFGALDAARRAGLPYVVLEHLYGGFYHRALRRDPLGLIIRLRGLRPQGTVDAAVTRIVTTLPALDPPPAGADLTQVGPVVEWSPREPATEPTVLVSLSTFGYPGMREALQRLVDAAGRLDARVVVTTGPAIDPAEIATPTGVEVHRFVPHHQLMRSATLFVGHGGHGGTMRALAHDLPMVLMPMSAKTDQPTVARSIEAAGAGRVVGMKTSVDELVPLLTTMLAHGPHRAAAARLGAEVRAMPGATLGADAVESLLSPDPHRPARA